MSDNRRTIISFLLDNDVDANDRLRVANEIDSRFDSIGEFLIVPDIIDYLEDEGDTPPLNYFKKKKGYDRITELKDHSGNYVEMLEYVEDEYDEHVKKEVIEEATNIVQGDSDDVQGFLDNVKKMAVDFDSRISNKELETGKEIYYKRDEDQSNIKTYVSPIDEKAGSLYVGCLSTIAAFTGQFKTTLALNQLYNNVVQEENNFVFLTLEMARENIEYKLLARHTHHEKYRDHDYGGMSPDRIQKHNLTEYEAEWIFEEVREDLFNNYGEIHICDETIFRGLSVQEMRSYFGSLPFTPDGIIVDYVQLLKHRDHPFDVYATNPINWYVLQFDKLAKDVDGSGDACHIVLLSQVNRSGYTDAMDADGKYELDAISEAHAIERNSSYIWFIFAPASHRSMNEALVHLEKNRYGETHDSPHTVPLKPDVGMMVEDEIDLQSGEDDVQDLIESGEISLFGDDED